MKINDWLLVFTGLNPDLATGKWTFTFTASGCISNPGLPWWGMITMCYLCLSVRGNRADSNHHFETEQITNITSVSMLFSMGVILYNILYLFKIRILKLKLSSCKTNNVQTNTLAHHMKLKLFSNTNSGKSGQLEIGTFSRLSRVKPTSVESSSMSC